MKKLNIFLTIMVSLLLAFPPAVLAGTVGTITYIEGRVDRRSVDENDYFPLVVGENIMDGDAIRTKSYSKAEVAFDDNSIVRLGGSTQIRVKDYEVGEDGYRKLGVIDLDRGRIRAIVSSTPEEAPFDINTLNASGSVKGSDVFVSFMQSATSVLVAEGVFSMTNPDFPDQRMDVSDGMASFVPHNAPPEDPRAFIPAEKDRYEAVTGPTVHKIEGAREGAEFTMATVAKVTGTVRVQPKGSKRWHAPVKNEVLNIGDKIETGPDGWILISFDNGLSIELRENTQLMIIQLARDLKTGDYDNIFESQYGEIISKLQNKPEKSTFVIKTPHAVCGVRGTIMYLKISPGGTKSFFEGGEGFVTDLLSGKTRVVQPGITSTIDEDGNVTETQTSDEERSEFGSEPGNEGQEEYGYTDPDSAGTGDPTVVEPVPAGTPVETDPPVDEPTPFDDVIPEVVESPYIWHTPVASGEGWGFLHFSFDFDEEEFEPVVTSSGEITGLMSGAGSLWSGSADVTLIGEYNIEDENASNLWALPVYSVNDTNETYTTYDGGAYFGALFGFHYKEDNVEGFMRALYVDPDKKIGYVSGGVSGLVYPESDASGMFNLEGTLNVIEKGSVSEVTGLFGAKGLYDYCEDVMDESHLFAAGFTTNISFNDLVIDEYSIGDYDLSEYDGPMEFIAGTSLSEEEFEKFITETGLTGKDFDLFVGIMLAKAISFQDVGWGIWGGAFLGAFAGDTPPSDSWTLPFIGMVGNEDGMGDFEWTDTVLFGRIKGTEWTPDGRVAGEINGIWMSADESGHIGIEWGKISGEVAGENEYIDAGEEFSVGTWEAAAAGEWVEVEDLLLDLTLTAPELEQIIGCDFISIPFAGTLSSTLVSGGIIDASMNVALFAQNDALIGMWAAEISGTYDPRTINENWNITFNNGADTSVDVIGTAWEEGGNWSADVEGKIEGNELFGTAAGTHYDDGSFSGAGVGGWIDKNIVDIVEE